MASRQISGFTVFPLKYSSSVTHNLYLKPHGGGGKSNSKGPPPGRTLFVVNVPPDANEEDLTLLFRHHGPIEKVLFEATHVEDADAASGSGSDEEDAQEENGEEERPRKRVKRSKGEKQETKKAKPVVTPLVSAGPSSLQSLNQSGQTAYVVFLDDSSLQRALSSASSSSPPAWPPKSSKTPRGLARYIALHNASRPPLSVVRSHADTSLELYDYLLAEKKAHLKSTYKKGESIVDDDGFTLVVRGGAYGQTVGGGVGVASKKFEKDGKKKKGKDEKKDGFYAFQVNEKKRNDLIKLKQDWEADKAKVAKLRQERKFKPY